MTTMQSELPEPLIQLIQSLLTSKQAAQTSLLSKSWHAAFFSRPNLDFDQTDFLRNGGPHRVHPFWNYASGGGNHEIVPFWYYVWNTIARYEEANQKIRSFRICVKAKWNFDLTRLILRALENGATHLTVQVHWGDFHVPQEVLGSKNLVSLTLNRAKISLDPLHQQVRCSMLESLCLEYVDIDVADLFSRILSSCPLLQNLSLSDINHIRYSRGFDDVDVVAANLPRLRSLVLVHVYFDTLFLRDLSSSFPVLKDLTLHRIEYQNQQDKLISSPSLERLEIKIGKYNSQFRGSRTIGIQCDLIPSIREFTFKGPVIPSLSFRSNFLTTPNRVMYECKEVGPNNSDHILSRWTRDVRFEILPDDRKYNRKVCLQLNWEP